jgi:hypothetical protein
MRSLKPFALAALLAAALGSPGPAPAQSAHGPTRDVVPVGRVAQLVWMLGNWDCRIIDRKDPEYATKAWRRIALGPGGVEIFVLAGMPDFLSRSRIGYSEKAKQWYEIDRVGDGPSKQQQTLVAPANALTSGGLTLEGSVPGKNKGQQYPLRGVYTWTDHDGFVFRAQLLRVDGSWLTFQKTSCRRTEELPN